MLGPTGATGPKGATGPGGPAGPRGPQGGTGGGGGQGAQGSQGPSGGGGGQGAQGGGGPQGFQGVDGPPGPRGPQGGGGPTGGPGPAGPTGPTGAQGAQGATGPAAVTCGIYAFFVGGSCLAACNFASTQNVRQNNAATGMLEAKYLNATNCVNGTCDWNSYWARAVESSVCYDVANTCGFGNYDSNCGTYYSDVNLKTKIETIYDALEKVMMLEAVEYDWNSNLNKSEYKYFEKNKRLHAIGLIAQNVRLYFPEVVSMNGEGYYYIDYNKLNSVLVEAIKSQQVFIEDIKEQINELENKLS